MIQYVVKIKKENCITSLISLAINDRYRLYIVSRGIKTAFRNDIILIEKTKEKQYIILAHHGGTKSVWNQLYSCIGDLLAWISYRLRWLINRSDVTTIISTLNASEVKSANGLFAIHINSLSQKSMLNHLSRFHDWRYIIKKYRGKKWQLHYL